jgi:arylsulfatase B
MSCLVFRIIALAALLFLAGGSTVQAQFAVARRPNFVIIVADDLGYGELGCYGGRDIPTPHIDSLAKNGVRFTNGYVTAPFCAASRAGLLTGRYQTRFGFEFNPISEQNADPDIGLPVDERTIADRLRDAGYATALFGKWHLGGTARFHPMRRGFDEFYGFLHEGHSFVPRPWEGVTTWLRRRTLPDGKEGRWNSPANRLIYTTHMGHNEPDYDADNPILRASQPVDEQEHLTDALAREAESFIDRHPQEPFLLLLSYNAVHSPMQGADAYMERFRHILDVHRRIFAAMLSHLDDSVGRVLKKLRDAKVDKHTLVVFISDNGGPTRELTSRNDPLRGGKGELYEGGIRVPFVMQWPGRFKPGQVAEQPVISLDLAATMLAAAEIKLTSQDSLDGIDLVPYLNGRQPMADRPLYWRVGAKAALRHGNWKVVKERGGSWELYDLASDVGEQQNLAMQQGDQLQQLTGRWQELNSHMVEPLWGPRVRPARQRAGR